jgi:hypothetical protein
MSSSADRQRAYRLRRANGRISLHITTDEAELLEILAEACLIDRNAERTRRDLERAVEQLLAMLARNAA